MPKQTQNTQQVTTKFYCCIHLLWSVPSQLYGRWDSHLKLFYSTFRDQSNLSVQLNSFQLLSRVQLFATPWTAARQAFLSITSSWSLLKLKSIESVMPSNHLTLCCPLLLLPSIFNPSKMSSWPDKHDGVITHLEPDILESEVKLALESITMNKASGGDGIPFELFQILKRWCCESDPLNMTANLENSAVATGLEKVSFHSNPKEGQCQRILKLLHNCIHLIG